MSLQYLLDGYNIIRQIPASAQKSLKAEREHLVQLIEQTRPQGSSNNSVTVIFDGKAGMWGIESPSKIKIVFSQDESADEKIKSMVAHSVNKRRIVVVTDDREIRFYVRHLGAQLLSVKDFIARMKTKSASAGLRSANDHHDEKHIPPGLHEKITSEFEKIWLRKEKAEHKSPKKKH